MAEKENGESASGAMPPYTAFQSIKTMLAQFKEHALPDRIDRSVLTNFSGAVGSQILTALKFLRLTDNLGHPTKAMKSLVAAYGTDDYPETLKTVLQEAYAPIFELNLATCSPSQFFEKFKRTYSGADDVIRKSITFFLNAASDAAVPVSSFIMKARKPRVSGAKRRLPKHPVPKGRSHEEEEEEEFEPPPPPPPAAGFLDKLMEKFPPLDPAWPDDVKAKWFDAFRELMSNADAKDQK